MSPVKTPIFIIGRFRSGTSHFWNVFNALDNYCAWYEPLHPQLLSHIKFTQPKKDHVNVEDYWANYRILDDLPHYFQSDFGANRLYLTEQDSWPELRRYINFLISQSGEKKPVLQFNRMDFRWSWLNGFYPQAKTLYLKRNPVQLWYSQRKHIPAENHNNESYADAYELMPWCADLVSQLPFLAPQKGRHGFFRFYILYRLSVIIGVAKADVVIDLDEDVFNSDDYLVKLKAFGLSEQQLLEIQKYKSVPDKYEPSDIELAELCAIMTEVDLLLSESGLAAGFGQVPLSQIKQDNLGFWQRQQVDTQAVVNELLAAWHQAQSVQIEHLAKIRQLESKQIDNLQSEDE